MALIKCSECRQTVSDKAMSCPHCGAPGPALIVPPPLPGRVAKKRSTTAPVLIVLLLGVGGIFLVLHNTDKQAPSATPVADSKPESVISQKRDADELARKKQLEADELARKQAEEAKCRTDLQCIGDKKSIEATFKCVPIIERLAKNNFEWTDRWYEPKFGRFRWKDQKNLVVTYLGDKIKFQNGFGAWILSRYECDYNIATGTVLDARASAGRLP
jgi:hypothetical protein